MANDGVVIVGGGIVGMATAYYLARAGIPGVLIERDAIGSHASGYAYGGPVAIASCGTSSATGANDPGRRCARRR
jgi:glycine/D-amino acid oxidase-like deaminating enzyme